jgi:F0F1-type ATP synthase membrane subunit a
LIRFGQKHRLARRLQAKFGVDLKVMPLSIALRLYPNMQGKRSVLGVYVSLVTSYVVTADALPKDTQI